MKKEILVNITELNIDGCGTDASALVWINLPADGRTADEVLSALKEKLKQVKKDAADRDECLDTDEMIDTALTALGLTAKAAEHYDIEF